MCIIPYITVVGQMAGNIIKKDLHHIYFFCKVCEVFQKSFSHSAYWLTAFDFGQRFRRIVSNTCLGRPKVTVFNVSQDFWSETIQR